MKTLFSIVFLVLAYRSTVTLAYVTCEEPGVIDASVDDDNGDPLLLSPYIDAGKIDEARSLAHVDPFLEDIDSYAGFFTVDKISKSHQYFWFIPNRQNDTPLILWLNGGPGCSSLAGLFTANGPFQVEIGEGDEVSVVKRMPAWTDKYHVLYIDQPIGVGFSFTQRMSVVVKQETVGLHLYRSLVQFYKMFPEYLNNDLYIAGESYAGKFVPAVSYKIYTSNNGKPEVTIPFKGMIIGNGFSDPENMLNFDEHLLSLGLIDEAQRVKVIAAQDDVLHAINSSSFAPVIGQKALDLLNTVYRCMGMVGLFDYTKNYGSENINGTYTKFLEKSRQSIHVGSVKYSVCSTPVQLNFFLGELARSVRPWIEELLDNGYRVLFFNGLLDLAVSHLATDNFLKHVNWSGAEMFGQAKKKEWKINKEVVGYYKSYKNLAYAKVRNAGHMATTDQPAYIFDLVNLFLENKLASSAA